jgi:hypothetical protein
MIIIVLIAVLIVTTSVVILYLATAYNVTGGTIAVNGTLARLIQLLKGGP